MNKILVPVDFSKHSEFALEVAAQIAKRFDASIVALHMMGLSEAVLTRDDSKDVMEAMYYMKLAEKRFGEFLDQPFLEGVEIESTVQNYKIFKEIDLIAQEFEADIIVMGSHGSSGLKDVFVGSNTEKVVRTSNVPVLVVKKRILNFDIERLLFACDFSDEFLPAFQKARDFAELFKCEFKLLYVNTPDRFLRSSEMEEKAVNFLSQTKEEGVSLFEDITYYCDNSVEDGIFTFSNKYRADIIGIPTHGRRGLAHFFIGSLGEDLVNHSETPVITFKI